MNDPLDRLNSDVSRRRTFAIISHPDAGKTTLTEKLLLYGDAIHLAGAVKRRHGERHTTSDWMEIERQRGISPTSSEYRPESRRSLLRPGPVSRAGRQVGGHVPPPASQVWVGGVDSRERVRRRLAQPGRERGHQHRFTGQGVAELESRPVGGDENAVDCPGQGPGHHLRGAVRWPPQDLPVEVMPQHRRRFSNET